MNKPEIEIPTDSVDTPQEPVDTVPVTAPSFAKGADLGWVTEMEDAGVTFYDADGKATECFTLMKQLGMNAVRLRVWVNPEKEYCNYCNLPDVLVKARRAKALGMDIMIDFHYSDWFADPSRQNTPSAWDGKDFEGIKVTTYGGYYDETTGTYSGYSFEGDLDGSDNWEYICSVDSSASWNAEYNYPVFNFANNYGSYAGLEGTEYESGWYVPSIAELYDVYTNKTTIKASMNAVGGFNVESGYYWSSSQSASIYIGAYVLNFYSGFVDNYGKDGSNNVLVLQALNAE